MRDGPFLNDQVARVFYASLRQLRAEQGGSKGPVWELLTREEQGWYIHAVELARQGLLPEHIHEAWAAKMAADGWSYGPEVDHAKRAHPELAKWDALGAKYRFRFTVLQMLATALTIDVPAAWDASAAVTAL